MTFEQFMKFSDKEKVKNYEKLDTDHDRFLARINEPIGLEVLEQGDSKKPLTKSQQETLKKLEQYAANILKDSK